MWCGDGAVVSHSSAGALWRLDGIKEGVITVSTPRNLRPPCRWLRVKRCSPLPQRDVTRHRGVPVTTPSRTVTDLAAETSQEELEIALECALRLGLTSIARMKRQVEAVGGKGKPGTGTLRQLLDERSLDHAPTHSVLEARFKAFLKRYSFPTPQQQHVVWRGSGKRAFVDFCYPSLQLVIEVDGFSTHGSRTGWQGDLNRQNDLVLAGWRVLRFTWEDVCHGQAGMARQLGAFFCPMLPFGESRGETNI